MHQLTRFWFSGLLSLGSFSFVQAQHNTDSSRIFTLGEVVVQAGRIDSAAGVSSSTIREFHRLTVTGALDLVPGVIQSNVGPRNESMVYVRGFDLRQTPVFIDGVPVYVPYDGYVDLARFTTFHLSRITVEKGGASVLYGPNTMGGVINLISSRPVHPFEVNAAAGWLTGGHEESLNLGGKLRRFYWQANASRFERDYYNPSRDFTPTKTEDGGHRNHSDNDDWKYGFKLGFTPNEKNEFAIGFSHQEGKKGNPVYAGSDTLNSLYKSPRYWNWPKWNKESLYLLSNSTLKGGGYIKTRFFYDQFVNVLQSFDNATYTTQTKGYAFTSYYNDYTFGGNAETGHALSAANLLKAAVHFKQDVHREHNAGEPVRKMADDTYSAGITDRQTLSSRLALEVGASYNYRQSVEAQNYISSTKTITNFPSNGNGAVNVQAKLNYSFSPNRLLTLTTDRMTRFATIKDRYSYKMGTALPNPDLHAENVFSTALQYKDVQIAHLELEGSIFYSRIQHVIQSVSNVQYDSTTGVWLAQSQNRGRAQFYGAEASLAWHFLQELTAGVNYSFIKRKNLDNPRLYFTDVPEHKLIGWVRYAMSRFEFNLNGEYDAARYSTSYGTRTPGFFIMHAATQLNLLHWLKVQGGVNNIFDRNYALTEGYPEQGRNYFARVLVSFAGR